jgi:cell division protein FtsL
LAFQLYELKYETRQLDKEAFRINREIDKERETIAILRAEWSYLTRPERIETLADQLLHLHPANVDQIVTESQFKNLLNSWSGTEEHPTENSPGVNNRN